MTPDEVLAALLELAQRTGIRVRFDELGARGGLCVVKGEPLVVLDVRAPHAERVEILAAALARFGVVPLYARPEKTAGPRARARPRT